ncbi:transposase, partial [Lacticaseibacillus rhamnosus]|nr:transposase [Lacticaseibacillus rhamnosus]
KTGEEKLTLHGNVKYHTGHDDYICYGCGARMRRDENAVDNLIDYAKSKVQG